MSEYYNNVFVKFFSHKTNDLSDKLYEYTTKFNVCIGDIVVVETVYGDKPAIVVSKLQLKRNDKKKSSIKRVLCSCNSSKYTDKDQYIIKDISADCSDDHDGKHNKSGPIEIFIKYIVNDKYSKSYAFISDNPIPLVRDIINANTINSISKRLLKDLLINGIISFKSIVEDNTVIDISWKFHKE